MLDLFANALNGFLFVYGSLREHQSNHGVLARLGINSKVIGRFTTADKYHLIGLTSHAYPFLVDSNTHVPNSVSTLITGEVYRVDHDHLLRLDAFEGDEYDRRAIECVCVDTALGAPSVRLRAFVFVAKKAKADAIVDQLTADSESEPFSSAARGRYERVPSGDWVTHLLSIKYDLIVHTT